MASERSSDRPTAQQRLAAKRAAAEQARVDAEGRRRRLLLVGAPVAVVVVVVAVLVIVKVATGPSSPKSGQQASAAPTDVVAKVSSVPASVLDAVGVGTASVLPKPISAPALTSDGKPRVVYIGADYCPFCAAERWPVVVALSRFGKFTNLGLTASTPSDVFPNTASLSFHGASYTSDYVTFTGTETQGNQVVNGHFAPLDKLSPDDQALFAKYNAPPYTQSAGGIPFTDIGGRYLISGASYDPQVLQGKTHAQIAAALSDPNSPITKAVAGSANLITAAICQTTSNKPATVCQSGGVTVAAAALAHQ